MYFNSEDKPFLILLAGLPGVGKSEVSRELSRMLKFCLLDKDDILNVLKKSPTINQDSRGRIAYDILFSLVEKHLSIQASTIVDTPLTFNWLRNRLLTLADNYNAIPIVVFCKCPSEVARQRIINRQASDTNLYADRTWEEHKRIERLFDPINDSVNTITLDTQISPRKNAEKMIEMLTKYYSNATQQASLEDE